MKKSSGLLRGRHLLNSWTSVVGFLRPSNAGPERGGSLALRSYSRPARAPPAQDTAQDAAKDALRIRKNHIEEARRAIEYARQHNQQVQSVYSRMHRQGPSSSVDVHEARRASNQAASTSAAPSMPLHLAHSERMAPGSRSGTPKLPAPKRTGRATTPRSATAATSRQGAAADEPAQDLPTPERLEKIVQQPEVIQWSPALSPDQDSFVQDVYVGPAQAYRAKPPGPPMAKASSLKESSLALHEYHEQFVEDIMPPMKEEMPPAVTNFTTEGSAAVAQVRGQVNASSPASKPQATAGTQIIYGSAAAPLQAGNLGVRSGGSSGITFAGRGPHPGHAEGQRLVAVSAAAQSDAAPAGSFDVLGADQEVLETSPMSESSWWLHHREQGEELDEGMDDAAAAAAAAAWDGAAAAAADEELGQGAAPPQEVFVVDTPQKARQAAARLRALHAANPGMFFSCDTEVANIDVSKESPCGHGTVICFSVYCGEGAHFGDMVDGQPADGIVQNQLWVDTMADGSKDHAAVDAIWQAFRDFFEDESIPKVWHNYSFDRHVLANVWVGGRPLQAGGFHADTMHMARLWDSSRRGKGYSLEALSGDNSLMPQKLTRGGPTSAKTGMKELFAEPKMKKDGTESKIKELPPMEDLQACPKRRGKWIRYSALDAKATHDLAVALEQQLRRMPCIETSKARDGSSIHRGMDPAVAHATGVHEDYTMWDLYCDYWRPFGELLTDMEREGMMVDREHLRAAEEKAVEDQENAKRRFREWVRTKVPDAEYMNICSGPQIRQLLFAGVANAKNSVDSPLELERTFKAPNVLGRIEEGKKVAKKQMDILIHGLWGRGETSPLTPEVYTPSGWPAVSTPVLRGLAGKPGAAKKALAELEGQDLDAAPASSFDEVPLEAVLEDEEMLAALDAGGDGAASLDALGPDDEDALELLGARAKGGAAKKKGGKGKKAKSPAAAAQAASAENLSLNAGAATAAGKKMATADMDSIEYEANQKEAAVKGYGKLFAEFGGGKEGLQACAAVDALCEVSAIDTLLSNFIRPLQGEAIATVRRDPATAQPLLDTQGQPILHRVHCSLNINTETGRLSARRPNLQNQPALEKDRYKVRKAFQAEGGNTLVVADYGQLELRLLAHMANCASMLDAFKLGGDFHSRTALGMYDDIKAAIERGECLLEWDSADGSKSPVPLLKDMFGSERRKAKVLNFSIAYGKTAHGLSRDWGTSLDEAKDTVARWYSDRPEVEEWQNLQRALAQNEGYVCTILGRRRQLPDARSGSSKAMGHALRAAINTPIQGSAADVATAAMLSIAQCPELKTIGWKMLLQVHDEVILEGPKDTAQRAQQLVVGHMERPFSGTNPLRVDLVVDSNIADTWYEAK